MYRIIVAIVLITTQSAATIIHVPGDLPSIQEGIISATHGDTILVQPGTYFEQINFEGKSITLGSLTLTTYDTSYISQTIIDGDSLGTVVTFSGGEDSSTVLAGFTIRNGNSELGGGGIWVKNAMPLLRHLTITSNFGEIGGGILCSDGADPTIDQLAIIGNSSWRGGGIACDSSDAEIMDVRVIGNQGIAGAGIRLVESNARLTNVTISNNIGAGGRGGGLGGGIFCENSNPILTDVIINQNQASKAGGIYCFMSQLSLNNVQIHRNAALGAQIFHDQELGLGGGILSRHSTIQMNDVTVTANSSGWKGGGLVLDTSTLQFEADSPSSIYLNQAVIGLDLLFMSDTVSTPAHVILDTFTTQQPSEFYAAPLDSFTFEISYGIAEPEASDLYVSPDGNNSNSGLNPEEPLKNINFALAKLLADSTQPRTIHLEAGTYSPSSNGEIYPLRVPSFVAVVGESSATTILDAESINGSVVFHQAEGAELSGVTITKGLCVRHGSGIYCYESNPRIHDVRIWDNDMPPVETLDPASLGGGVYLEKSSPTLTYVSIRQNSGGFGSGLYCFDNSNPVLSYVEITNNTDAAVVCEVNSSMALLNLTIAGNSSQDNHHAAVSCDASSSVIAVNSIIWDHENGSFDGDGTITVAYSTIEGGWSGTGNSDADPQFADTAAMDYTLSMESPCIDAGIAFLVLDEDTLIDLDPAQYWGAAPDMGAIEYGMVNIGSDAGVPSSGFELNQNYPNPFNPETTIDYSIPVASEVILSIHDILGRTIVILYSGRQEAGHYELPWTALGRDGVELGAGVYFYRLLARGSGTGNVLFSEVGKMVLVN